jgi:hypothetical protein
MPTDEDEWRATHQAARLQILTEDHDEVVKAWLKNYVHEDILDGWGEPDISVNPLASYAKQMTTPGRYWRSPSVTHGSGDAVASLVGPSGALSAAGYWTKRQTIAFRSEGMGDDLVRLDVIDGRLVVRIVNPADVYIEVDPDDPSRVVRLWELRLRCIPDALDPDAPGEWVYAWDQYDVGTATRAPSWRIVEALPKHVAREPRDLSGLFLARPDGSYGVCEGLEGPARYPFVDDAQPIAHRKPYLPWVRYASVDADRVWNWRENRGLHRGTLHTAAYATYTGRAALDASGSFAIAWGLSLPADAGRKPGATREDRLLKIRPGSILFAEADGKSTDVRVMGPAGNLEAVSSFNRGYVADLQKQKGLGGADAEKQAANPSSGAALYISDRQRHEYQERTEPLDRKSDLDAIRKAALLLNAATGTTYPTDGYTIVYPRRRRSPQEEADERTEQEWETTEGYRSRVQIYQQRNPGTTREDAIRALAQVMADEAQLDAEMARIKAEQSASTPALAPPVPGEDEPDDDTP